MEKMEIKMRMFVMSRAAYQGVTGITTNVVTAAIIIVAKKH